MAGATRERILAEATRLFAEGGIKATTVADIEGAAGLRRGSGGVHRYFPTKHDLVCGVLEAPHHTRRVFDDAREWEPPTPETIPAFLARLGRYMLTNRDDNREGRADHVPRSTQPPARDARRAQGGEPRPLPRTRQPRPPSTPAKDMQEFTDLDADTLAFLVVAPLIYFRFSSDGRPAARSSISTTTASWRRGSTSSLPCSRSSPAANERIGAHDGWPHNFVASVTLSR